MVTYDAQSPRVKGGKFVYDDTAINCWGVAEEGDPVPYVDGEKGSARRGMAGRDVRNSLFRDGRRRLGDRHILELEGKGARLTYVDAKVCPNRAYLGIDSKLWHVAPAAVTDFSSQWGAPYGSRQAQLAPSEAVEIDLVCTDLSVAYVDTPGGGSLRVLVDGAEKLLQPTNVPFSDLEKEEHYMENRKGLLGLGFGLHRVRIEAVDGPVSLLGVFTYDSRPNAKFERRFTGRAAAGETVPFTLPFRARPLVICHGGLAVRTEDIARDEVTFGGEGDGLFEVIGE